MNNSFMFSLLSTMESYLSDKRIIFLFFRNRRGWPVTRVHNRSFVQHKQSLLNGMDEFLFAATRKICPANALLEKGVP